MSRIASWENLYDESKGLTKPFSIDNLVTEIEIIDLEKSVIRILNNFLDKGELHNGIKVYVNKILRQDFVDKMEKIRPKEEETIEEWTKKIFGEDKFGIVFNSLEAYDNILGEIMSTIVAPIIRKGGLPLGGLSFLFFMGNYGLTPFGIHKEAKGEEGFLFHLGPGKKEFYTWDKEELNRIEHNTKVFHEEIEEMLPSSKKYVLDAGSVMFIPHQVYHIANTEAFSLSIVMDYINPSKDYLEKELAKEISYKDYSQNENKSYLAPVPMGSNSESLENYLNAESIMSKFRNAYDKRILMLKSNAGILRKSIKYNTKRLPNGEFNFRGKKIFPIYLFEDEDNTTILLARGNELIKKSNSKLKNVLTTLNNGEILSFRSLKNCLTPEWDLVDVYSFINELFEIDAVEIVIANTLTNKD